MTVIRKLDDGGVALGGGTVVGEEGVQQRTQHTALGLPVLTVLVPDVRVPTLTVWGLSMRKSRTQLQREGVSPRMRSFSASLVGRTVLNAEL